MTYTQEQESIRMALTNFIGSLYSNSKYESSIGKKNVNAIIVEEMLKLSQKEDGTIDLLAISPLFNSVAWSMKNEAMNIEKSIKTEKEAREKFMDIKSLKNIAEEIEKYVSTLK